MREVYLDYNASAPIRAEVSQAISNALDTRFGNPSSVHRPGHRAKVLLEDSRASVASLLGAANEEIVFTSGGTEANNLAIFGASLRHGSGHLIVTSIEHSSVLEPALELERRGFRVTRVRPDPEGWVSPESVLSEVTEETFFVSMMHSNHEIGTLQEVEVVAKALRAGGILLHCDAVQSAGKVPLDVRTLGADLVSLSAHKIGGAAGAGCLWIREGVELSPCMRGGGQEINRRAGTQALCLIAGFGEAAKLAREELTLESRRIRRLRDELEDELAAAFGGVRIHGQARPRLPGTCHFALPGFRGEDLVTALDLEGVAVSTGSACAVGTMRPSHVLMAMGCRLEEAEASVRLSLGHGSRRDDLVQFLQALAKIARRRSRVAMGEPASC